MKYLKIVLLTVIISLGSIIVFAQSSDEQKQIEGIYTLDSIITSDNEVHKFKYQNNSELFMNKNEFIFRPDGDSNNQVSWKLDEVEYELNGYMLTITPPTIKDKYIFFLKGI